MAAVRSSLRLSLLFTFAVILILIQPVLGQEYEEHRISVTTMSVRQLINVSTPINLSVLIPYQTYSSVIVVEWAIPEPAMVGLGDGTVLLFVTITTANESEYISFVDEGGVPSKKAALVLKCNIEAGRCGEGSELRKEIPYNIRIDRFGVQFSDTIVVRASLIPFEEFSMLEAEAAELNAAVADMREEARGLNISGSEIDVFVEQLDAVKSRIERFELDDARADLARLNSTLGTLKQKSDLLSAISAIDAGIKQKLRETNLTDEELEMAESLADLLIAARNATESADFHKAGLLVNFTEKNYALLSDMITERVGPIGFLRQNAANIGALVLAIILTAVSLTARLRKIEKAAAVFVALFIAVAILLGIGKVFGEAIYFVFMAIETLIILFFVYMMLKRKRTPLRGDTGMA